MNRREALKSTFSAAAAAAVFRHSALLSQAAAGSQEGDDTIYLNATTGADTNSGAKGSPLSEAWRRPHDESTKPRAQTRSRSGLSEGVYAVGETTVL